MPETPVSGTTEPKAGSRINTKPVRVEPKKATVAPQQARKLFWCGTAPGSPLQSTSAAGVSFESHRIVRGSRSDQYTEQPGVIHALTQQEVEKVREVVARKVVRLAINEKDGTITQAWKLDVDSVSYRQEPRDIPLGCFLYMHKVESEHVARTPDLMRSTMVPRDPYGLE